MVPETSTISETSNVNFHHHNRSSDSDTELWARVAEVMSHVHKLLYFSSHPFMPTLQTPLLYLTTFIGNTLAIWLLGLDAGQYLVNIVKYSMFPS